VLPHDWQQPCTDLKQFLSCYAGLLDANVSIRETIRHLVRQRYGGGPVPFLKFMYESKQIFGPRPFEGWSRNNFTINPCQLDSLRRLADLRKEFSRFIVQPSDQDELDLKVVAENYRWNEKLGQLGLAPAMEDAFCISCHCQPIKSNERDTNLVINLWSAGPFRALLRTCSNFGMADCSEIAAEIRNLFSRIWPNAEPCELFAPSDYNANLHKHVTDRRICYEDGKVPDSMDIPLANLAFAVESGKRLMLIETSSGRYILPLQFGMIGSIYMPVLQHFLLSVGNLDLVLQKNLFHPHHWLITNGSRAAIERFPRLIYGRCILRRKGWSVLHDELPPRNRDANDLEHFLLMRRWQQNVGLPDEVFVFLEKPDAEGSPTEHAAGRNAWNNRKPQYIDFRNYFLVQILEKIISSTTGRLYFEEMLPSGESWNYWNFHRPTEFVLGMAV
jgi:hypothetical protein